MQQKDIERLKHFIVFGPVNLTEVTECLHLTMQRAHEIRRHFLMKGEAIPEQLRGELNLLKDLSDQALLHGEEILAIAHSAQMNSQGREFCGAMHAPSVTIH